MNNEKKVFDSKVSQLYFASLNPGRLMTGNNLKIFLNTIFGKNTPVELCQSKILIFIFSGNNWSSLTSGAEKLD